MTSYSHVRTSLTDTRRWRFTDTPGARLLVSTPLFLSVSMQKNLIAVLVGEGAHPHAKRVHQTVQDRACMVANFPQTQHPTN